MDQHGVIPEFRGEYYFLSNYATTPFVWRGIDFESGEQAFAYAKTHYARTIHEAKQYQRRILEAKTPSDAGNLGRQCPIDVVEWDSHKVTLMREIIHAKFSTSNNAIVGKLINTKAKMLVAGNDWGDAFWGRCKKDGKFVGLNTLGVILMEERGRWLQSYERCGVCSPD